MTRDRAAPSRHGAVLYSSLVGGFHTSDALTRQASAWKLHNREEGYAFFFASPRIIAQASTSLPADAVRGSYTLKNSTNAVAVQVSDSL